MAGFILAPVVSRDSHSTKRAIELLEDLRTLQIGELEELFAKDCEALLAKWVLGWRDVKRGWQVDGRIYVESNATGWVGIPPSENIYKSIPPYSARYWSGSTLGYHGWDPKIWEPLGNHIIRMAEPEYRTSYAKTVAFAAMIPPIIKIRAILYAWCDVLKDET